MWISLGWRKILFTNYCVSLHHLSHLTHWNEKCCQKKASVCVCVWARESRNDRKHPVVCREITGIDVRNEKNTKYNKKKITELHRCTAFVAVSRWPWRRSSQKQIKHNLNAVQWRQLPTLQSDPSAENSFISQKAFKTPESAALPRIYISTKRCSKWSKSLIWQQCRGEEVWEEVPSEVHLWPQCEPFINVTMTEVKSDIWIQMFWHFLSCQLVLNVFP